MRQIFSVVALAAFGLGGCSSVSRPMFISDTMISKEVLQAGPGDVLLYEFQQAAQAAQPVHGSDPGVSTQRRFLRSGFALIYGRCNAYILAKSDSQRKVNVWRDTIAPITALASGVVALVDNGDTIDNGFLAAFAVATSATSAGFKIYEERYLFGAENVNSVRRLVLDALNSNAAKALQTDDRNLDYIQAVIHLLNNQSVCSPGHILELVGNAIQQGKVESTKTGDLKTGQGQPEATNKVNAFLDQLLVDKILSQAEVDTAKAKLKPATPLPPPPIPSVFETVVTRVSVD